jgi:kynurenine formamidase
MPRLVSRVFQYAGDTRSADDFLFVNTHARTHIDGLAHVWKGKTLYNGFDAGSVLFNSHADKCGIEKVGAIINRGVLLDVARLKEMENLQRGTVITARDLEECAKAEKIKFYGGETLLIRTGWLRKYDKENPLDFHREAPGVNLSVVDYIDKNQIAVVGGDTSAFEIYPSKESSDTPIPVHIELIWKRGIHIIEQMNLEKLATDKVWEFLFVLIPLPISGALGSPVNPIAVR